VSNTQTGSRHAAKHGRYNYSVAENPYEKVAYPAYPRRQTHPDRLASVGALLGMHPVHPAASRVLEIGCSDGGNLIPMAFGLPGSRFVGVDLAGSAIAAAEAQAAELELDNIEFEALDLREIGARHGEFDYIIAHGLYSWVPPEIRDRLMAICGERLTPRGICFISYNALPGGYARQMMRDALLYHTRATEEPAKKLKQSRWFLETLRTGNQLKDGPKTWLESEVNLLLKREDPGLYHDELGSINDPIYFQDFAAHAERHGLQFLSEADVNESLDPHGLLHWVQGGVMEREQYRDFLRLRRFRQSLLCRSEVTLNHDVQPAGMERFLFSAPSRKVEENQVEGYRGMRVTVIHPDARQVTSALGDAYPQSLSFAELLPHASTRLALEEILHGLVISGFADNHLHDFPCENQVTDKPRVSRLARVYAEAKPFAVNLRHEAIQLDQRARNLVRLLDGSRDYAAIAHDFAALPGSPDRDEIEKNLRGILQRYAKYALMEA
jgi:methyltransferase-like protein